MESTNNLKSADQIKVKRKKSDYIFTIVFSIVCLFWVLNTQMMARADQVEIQEAAFRVHFGDFGELQKTDFKKSPDGRHKLL